MSYFLSIPKNPEVSILSCNNITGSANAADPFYLVPTYLDGQFNPITGSDIILTSGYEYFLEFVPISTNSININFSLEIDSNIVNTGWSLGSSTVSSTIKNVLMYTYKPDSNSIVKMKINSSAVNSTIITNNTRLIIWRVL